MLHDSPESLVQIITNELVWPEHALGREISGTKESVAGLTRERMLSYMARHYGPTKTVVSVAGAIDSAEIQQMVAESFGQWQPTPGDTPDGYSASQVEPRSRVAYKDTEQAHICLALPSIHRDHPDRFTFSLANTILGDGMSSRLFQEIRERRGLAYSVDSFVSFLQDTGMFGVYAGVDPERATLTLQAILTEMSRLRQELVSPAELRRSIEFNKGRLLLQMENTSSVAAWYGRQEVLPGDVLTVDQVVERLEQTTREDILRIVQQVFDPSKFNLAVVGPFQNVDPFAGMLQFV